MAACSGNGTAHGARHVAAPRIFSGPSDLPCSSQGVPLAAAAAMSMPHDVFAATEVVAKPVRSSVSTEKTATKRRRNGARMLRCVATKRAWIKR